MVFVHMQRQSGALDEALAVGLLKNPGEIMRFSGGPSQTDTWDPIRRKRIGSIG